MSILPKILLFSEARAASQLWASTFARARWSVIMERDLTNAVSRMNETSPDIVIFEVDASEASVLNVIGKFREEAVVPILLLTSNRTEEFMLDAYEAGADDYILKPLSPALLHAKIKAWLRHSLGIPVNILESLRIGNFRLVPSERTLVLNDCDSIRLTNLELRLLYSLMSRPGRTMTSEELYQRVWSNESEGDGVTLKNVVYRLRRKIEANPAQPHYIRTVSGIGYEFTVA